MNAIVPARFEGVGWLAAEPADNTTAAPAKKARTPRRDTRRAVRNPCDVFVRKDDLQVDRSVFLASNAALLLCSDGTGLGTIWRALSTPRSSSCFVGRALRRRAHASIRQTSYLSHVSFVTYLRQSDYHAALALVSEAAATNGSQPFETPTIERLLRLVPGDRAGYFEYSNGGVVLGSSDTYLVEQPVGSNAIDWRSDTVAATVSSWPLRDIPAGFARVAVKLSNFLSGTRLRKNPWYSEVMRPGGVEHECKLWLSAPSGTVRGFFVVRDRGTRDFDERDLALLELLRPHLVRIRTRWETRRGSAGLTRREVEVLELVAKGKTNAEVAARLVISRATVRTHLENIFEKLDVHTRTAAAARLYDRNSLPSD